MYWREAEQNEPDYQVPDDVVDLLFRLRGRSVDVDHAWDLSEALKQEFDPGLCARIGVHGIRLPDSGNGWQAPDAADAEVPLSRRARLAIRVGREDRAAVAKLEGRQLRLGDHEIQIGVCSERPLSSIETMYARAVLGSEGQSEDDFLRGVADELAMLDIPVTRLLCGRSGAIRSAQGKLVTRALLIADLKPEQAVRLQQQGIGEARLLGCGLFVPHKGIDAVHGARE